MWRGVIGSALRERSSMEVSTLRSGDQVICGPLEKALDARTAKRFLELVQDGMEPIGWEKPIMRISYNHWKIGSRQVQWLVAGRCPKHSYSYGGPNVGDGKDRLV